MRAKKGQKVTNSDFVKFRKTNLWIFSDTFHGVTTAKRLKVNCRVSLENPVLVMLIKTYLVLSLKLGKENVVLSEKDQ